MGVNLSVPKIMLSVPGQNNSVSNGVSTRICKKAFDGPRLVCELNIDGDNLLDDSFRAAAYAQKTPMLVYETGEALRFNEVAIRAGVKGVLNVMASLDIRLKARKRALPASMIANTSR